MPGKASKKSSASPAKRAKRSSSRKAKNTASKSTGGNRAASQLIDDRIKELGDWRGEMLQHVREIIRATDPAIAEEWKWETPVWSCNGILCTGETYKQVVKLTFPKGASLKDPAHLFNSSLDGKVRRAIDIREGDTINKRALSSLIRAAIAVNRQSRISAGSTKPVLLTGGNPQIGKADGDAPVQAYIAAIPGWKQDLGRRLDALIVRNIPHVQKAIRWNSPFYGIEGQGWLVSFHVFTRYVKVTFFNGTSLKPVPPGGTDKNARWIDIHEDDLDEAQMSAWLTQSAAIPGWGKC